MPMDIFDAVNPAQLTGYVRAALSDFAVNQFRLSAYLPDKPIPDIEYRFFSGGAGLVDAAQVSVYDAEAQIGQRPGVVRVQGELPPIKRKVRLGEYDRLRLRNAGTDEISNVIFDDGKRMGQSIAGRLEMFRGEALTTGKLTINENNVVATVDYGRLGSHTITAGVLWTDHVNSTPITDLITWYQLMITDTGVAPTRLVLSVVMLNHILQNAQVKSISSALVTPQFVSRDIFEMVLGNYLPGVTLDVYDVQLSVAGTPTRIIPTNKVVLLNDDQLGATLLGVTGEQLTLANVTGEIEPGIVAVATNEYDPPSVWTKAAAIGIPVLANPNLTIGATVG